MMNSTDITIKECISVAIKHIGIGTYSSGKIYYYLVNKGFSEDIVSTAIDELIARGYIDDYKASRKVLLSRSGSKQESRHYIGKRLEEAGISRDVIKDIVSKLPSDYETCKLLLSSIRNLDASNESKESFLKIASRRGYDHIIASNVFEDEFC